MRKILILSILLFYNNISYGIYYTTESILIKNPKKEVQDSIISLCEKLQFYEKENLGKTNNQLDITLLIAKETIQSQNSIINSFGVIYSIITIIIALLGLILPILVYMFGIRPARKAVVELQKDIDDKIANYITSQRNKQVNQSITNLENQSPVIRNNAISFLTLSLHDGLSDLQIFNIYQLLKDNKIDETIEEHLLHILSHRKSNFADDYFKELLFDNNRVKFRPYVYIYYANAGIENYFDVIIDFLNECKISKSVLNVGGGLYQILDTIYKISKDTFVKILNNIEIVDLMDEKELMSFRDSLKGFQYKKGIYKNYLSLINETYLMTK